MDNEVLLTGVFDVAFVRHGEKPENATAARFTHLDSRGRATASGLVKIFCGKNVQESVDPSKGGSSSGCQYNIPMQLYARTAEKPKYVLREVETLQVRRLERSDNMSIVAKVLHHLPTKLTTIHSSLSLPPPQPMAEAFNLPIKEVGINETAKMRDDIFDFARETLLVRAVSKLSEAPLFALICWEHFNFERLGPMFGCSEKQGRTQCPSQMMKWPNEDFHSIVVFRYMGGHLVDIKVDVHKVLR